jgi:protein-tyrosine-phosphatase/DNA-binding transcriptional ArsR family regulator
MNTLETRARAYAALGDTSRLAIVELLANADLAPGELGARLDVPTNLMAHHLQILEQAGLVLRRRSEGDGRRSYVQRTPACNQLLGGSAAPVVRPRRVAFVCSQNSARSQLAEHYWRTISDVPVLSAGTHPAPRVHPRAVAVGRRHGLDLAHAAPKLAGDVLTGEELVIAVCDRAYEELGARPMHWSVPDPARTGALSAFQTAYDTLTGRVDLLAASLEGGRS